MAEILIVHFFDFAQRDPRMGRQRELRAEEKEVLSSIFRSLLKHGKCPAVEELQLSLKRSDEEIIRVLDELERKGDYLLRKRGTQEIISIYPISLKPTEHQIFLEDRTKLFAMCAVDALGMPTMFNKNVRIVSRCEECKSEMVFEIKNEQITFMSHPDAAICSPKHQVYPAAETCCPLVNFFCSKKHANEWITKNELKNNIKPIVSVQQGFPKIKTCWKRYGKLLGFR
jgi:hypothetical protein